MRHQPPLLQSTLFVRPGAIPSARAGGMDDVVAGFRSVLARMRQLVVRRREIAGVSDPSGWVTMHESMAHGRGMVLLWRMIAHARDEVALDFLRIADACDTAARAGLCVRAAALRHRLPATAVRQVLAYTLEPFDVLRRAFPHFEEAAIRGGSLDLPAEATNHFLWDEMVAELAAADALAPWLAAAAQLEATSDASLAWAAAQCIFASPELPDEADDGTDNDNEA